MGSKVSEESLQSVRHSEQESVRDHQTYLRVAELVLANALSPLKAREIVDRGIERGLFGDHVLSRTPEKSMQARLSMDILNRGNASKFARTARGRFTLRSKLTNARALQPNDHSRAKEVAGAQPIEEYIAERRVLRTPAEEVLCVSESTFADVLTFQGIDTDPSPILGRLLSERSIHYIPRSQAESRDDAKQFVTYVLVQCGQRLLCYRRSYLSRAAEFLRGSKCIGFGGHVSAADVDILSREDQGLSACARRELMEELFLPNLSDRVEESESSGYVDPKTRALPRTVNRATVRLFQRLPLEQLGILNDDSSEVGRRHVAVVYRVWLPEWEIAQRLQKGDSSIKGLSWLDISQDKVDVSEFEYWSQLCLRKFYPSNVISESGFKILRKAGLSSHRAIVVAGRVGSGKSETASYLSQRLGLPLLKSGCLLQDLMGCPPITEIGREEFQYRALEFIQRDGGPQRLAAYIGAHAAELGASRCIIDGIRHLSTYENLFQHFCNDVGLVFVQTPPDVAYDMYRAREAQDELTFTYRDFLKIYDAPVEEEIPSLGRKAQIYIYNAFGMEAIRRTIDEVAEYLSAKEGQGGCRL